jgi:hypothetical protein
LPDLFLDRRIPLEARDRDEVEEIAGQLGQLGHSGLNDDGACLRVDADGEVVQRHFHDVVADLLGPVRVIR